MKTSKIISAILFITTILFSFYFFQFRNYAKEFEAFGLLGLFIINMIGSGALFNPAPTFLTVIAGGSIYPPLIVALVAASGSALGDLFSYSFGASGRGLTHEKFEKKKWFRFVERNFKKYGWLILVISAFVPNFLFDPIGMLAGISYYSPVKYVMSIFIGRFFRYFIFAEIGSRFFSL